LDQLARRMSFVEMREALARADMELEVIFGGYGKRSLLEDVTQRYGLSLSDALLRPGAFQSALHHYLGDLGSEMVMGRINRRVWGIAGPVPRSKSGSL